MRHFILPPTVGLRCRPFIIPSACPFFDWGLIRYDTPRTLRTSWGTQAIGYSWASLDTFHAAQTSFARIQDVDVILIWRFHLPGIEPGIPRSRAGIKPLRQGRMYQVLIHASVAERFLVPTLDRGIPGSIPGRLNLQIKITSELSVFVFMNSCWREPSTGQGRFWMGR